METGKKECLFTDSRLGAKRCVVTSSTRKPAVPLGRLEWNPGTAIGELLHLPANSMPGAGDREELKRHSPCPNLLIG